MTNTLAKYTLIEDGDTAWYAETADLVAGLVAAGYTYERFQGYDAVAEPTRDDEDGPDGGAPYSILCSYVSAVSDEDQAALKDEAEMVETLTYEPGTVGERRFRVTRDLGEAVWAATPN